MRLKVHAAAVPWRRIALAALTVAALVFFSVAIARAVAAGFEAPEVRSWGAIGLALGFAVAQTILAGSLFGRCLGPERRSRKRLAAFCLSQAAKYIPGRIWGVALQRALVDPSTGTWRLVEANALTLAAVVGAQCLGALAVWVGLQHGWGAGGILFLLVLAIALGLDGAFRHRAGGGEGHWRRWIGLAASPRLAVEFVLMALLVTATWLVFFGWGLGVEGSEAGGLAMASMLSFVAGLASVLPAGLGIREAVFVLLADTQGMVADAVAIALASRLMLLAVDAVVAAIGALLWFWPERSGPSP